MKLLVVVVCVVAAVVAAPQDGYREDYFQRQEEEATPTPYPPSGYRPSRQFLLPTERRELLEPSDPRALSDDEEPTTTTDSTTTTDNPTTTAASPTTAEASQLSDVAAPPTTARQLSEARDVEEVEATDAHKTPAQADAQGVYYVLLPTGQLQRVQYLTRVDDVRRMAYTAQLKYEKVEPISGPIYSYDPNESFLQVVAE